MVLTFRKRISDFRILSADIRYTALKTAIRRVPRPGQGPQAFHTGLAIQLLYFILQNLAFILRVAPPDPNLLFSTASRSH